MKKFWVLFGISVALASCATANIEANLRAVNDLLIAGERNLAVLCAGMPTAAVAAETLTCYAKANKTTADVVARSIAAAQAVCMGTVRPPTFANALDQIQAAAQAAANAQALGCP